MAHWAEDLAGYGDGEPIAAGGLSSLYRAHRLRDGATLTVKRSTGRSPTARELIRYRNEYDLLRALDCKGVPRAFELIRDKGHIALVLEDLKGCTLRAWIESSGDATLAERVEIALRLAETVAEVHAAQIIHRNISALSIIYDRRSRTCKLVDFGFATRLRTQDGQVQAATAMEGALAYIAPEQTGRMNRMVDHRADLYSLGVTLYEVFTGHLPNTSGDPLELVHFHIAGAPIPPRDTAARVPDILSDLVMKLLQKEPNARYQSAAGLAADLRCCLEALSTGAELTPFTLGSHDPLDRLEAPQKVYGREPETATLLECFKHCARGGVTAAVVTGPNGIGKTSLIQNAYRPITRRIGYLVAGKFDQTEQHVPFSALVMALQDLVQQLLTESEDSIAGWRAAILEALHPNAQLIVDVVPALELIIGAQPKVTALNAQEAQLRFNLVFQRFLQVFCKKARPFVLFLDDAQWADSASLNLITMLLTARDAEALLVVLACRSTEPSVTSPVTTALAEQAKQGVPVTRIELRALPLDDVAEFVADALRQDVASATPLAEIVLEKTGGNPFFMGQFLQALHSSKLLTVDGGTFQYDPAAVRGAAITDNVADLLAAKLDRLPRATQQAVQMAAVIGPRFDLRLLAGVCHSTPEETDARLRPAVDDGLIAPLTDLESLGDDALESPLVYGRFAFRHERLQQTAAAALDETERARLHLAIGRALHEQTPAADLDSQLFDISGHMDQGRALITDESERLWLAELNVRAGTKARDATAFDVAARKFELAIELLGEAAWQEHYELQREAHERLAEALSLTAGITNAFPVIKRALEHARSPTDRANLHAIEMNALLLLNRIPEALACGRAAARLFEVDLPGDSEQIRSRLATEIEAIRRRTATIDMEQLLNLPRMEDPAKAACMALLAQCMPAAFQHDQDYYALVCCTMVRLSLEHGNCTFSPRAYGSYAALLSAAFAEYAAAYRFGKLGVDLAYKLDAKSSLCGTHFLWAMFASHWCKHLDESIELFRRSVEYGLQTGDPIHAGYSAARRITHQQFRGMPLDELQAEIDDTLVLLARLNDTANPGFLQPVRRLVAWLQGNRRHGDTLADDDHDEAAWTTVVEARGNRSFESDWFRNLAMQRYHCGDFAAAYTFGQRAESLKQYSSAFVTQPPLVAFLALAITALYKEADEAQRAAYDSELRHYRKQLRDWAELCPENQQHRHLLVEAECARIEGKRIEAADAYDRAIAAARAQGLLDGEALALELCARFWRDDGKPEFARLYLHQALHAYAVWGAHGKVADLRTEYGLTAERDVAAPATATSAAASDNALDLATVLKASQAIAGEIVLERLLASLLEIIVENAGAESTVLVLEGEGGFLVQGVKTASEPARVLLAEPLQTSTVCSRGIVNYVIRTAQHLVLAEPANHGQFRNDPYVRNRQPKSVLCAPLLHKGKLVGVVYLENNQVAGAFTADRLEALNILMAQIAVSIENATLYAKQEQQARAIEAVNVSLTVEIEERRRAEKELSRYRDHLQELVDERTAELERAQRRLVDVSRQAGMAEVAAGVLHNVGNVMNSVNVGTEAVRDAVKGLPIDGLSRAADLLHQNAARLPEYLGTDTIGKKLPSYFGKLAAALTEERQRILVDVEQLVRNVEHMKTIIAAQQSYAKLSGMTEACQLRDIAEEALTISDVALRISNVEVTRRFADLPAVIVDRHQILQILVNLISNSRHALDAVVDRKRELLVSISAADGHACLEVRDNGIGIPRENLSKVFTYGFTTKKQGHGFGLHNCAIAAQQMHGSLAAHSDGPGAGASFVLRLPLTLAEAPREQRRANATDGGGRR